MNLVKQEEHLLITVFIVDPQHLEPVELLNFENPQGSNQVQTAQLLKRGNILSPLRQVYHHDDH